MHEIEVFPNLTTSLELYKTLPRSSCGDEINFLKLSLIKNKFLSTTLEDRLKTQSSNTQKGKVL